tara:strand:- start:6052 stop:6462 length:411 start_codon:yes stop_codon:yes gene_type:complete
MTIYEDNQTFVNMTPHEINMVDDNGEVLLSIQPSGNTIRLSEEWGPLGEFHFDIYYEPVSSCTAVDDEFVIPIKSVQMKIPDDGMELPPIRDNVWYIVSRAVCETFTNRTDFLMVGQTVRNDKGQIIGAKCFSQLF